MRKIEAIYPASAIICIILAVVLALIWNGNDWTSLHKGIYLADVFLAVFFVIKTRKNS